MTASTTFRGTGHATNPLDGDEVTIELTARDERVRTVVVRGVQLGIQRVVGESSEIASFVLASPGRASGRHTLRACPAARTVALGLHRVLIGRTIDECLDVTPDEVRSRVHLMLTEDRGCVATVLAAVRTALIDIQVTELAEAIVDGRAAGTHSPR